MIVQVPAPTVTVAGMAGRNAMFPGQQMGGAKGDVGGGMGGMPCMAGGSPRFGPGGMMADATGGAGYGAHQGGGGFGGSGGGGLYGGPDCGGGGAGYGAVAAARRQQSYAQQQLQQQQRAYMAQNQLGADISYS